jgi:hypothetical protein
MGRPPRTTKTWPLKNGSASLSLVVKATECYSAVTTSPWMNSSLTQRPKIAKIRLVRTCLSGSPSSSNLLSFLRHRIEPSWWVVGLSMECQQVSALEKTLTSSQTIIQSSYFTISIQLERENLILRLTNGKLMSENYFMELTLSLKLRFTKYPLLVKELKLI